MIEAILLVAVGLLLCFAGYRLFHSVLPLSGFLLFFLATWSHLRGGGEEGTTLILASVLAGVIGAVLAHAWLFLALFLVGVSFGGSLALHLAPGASETILGLIALASGLVALFAQKPLLILASAYWGGRAASIGVAVLLGERVAGTRLPFAGFEITGAIALGLILAGVVVQVGGTRRLEVRRL